ncbi:MAG: monovalent cation/H+ antiporter complex subunit F [Fibrobacterota bacterium]
MNWLIYTLLGLLALSSLRIFMGPSFQDRLLGLSVVQSIMIVLFCIMAVDKNITYYLDLALLLSLLSFAEVIAFSKLLLKDRSFLSHFDPPSTSTGDDTHA